MSPNDPDGVTTSPSDDGIQRYQRLITRLNACLEVDALEAGELALASGLTVRWASPSACTLFGSLSPSDLVGRKLGELFPEDSCGLIDRMIRAASEGVDLEPDTVLARSLAGKRIGVRVMATRWAIQSICLVLASDELKVTPSPRLQIIEQRYGRLFNDVPIALMRVDSRGALGLFTIAREAGYHDLIAYLDDHPAAFEAALDGTVIVEANNQAVKMFGDGTRESVLCPVRSYYRLAPEAFKRNMAAAFAGARHYSEEVVMCGAAGQQINVLFTIAYPDGEEIEGNSFVGMVDISDRLRAEAKLQRTQAEFARVARMSLMGEFAASIAHEITQPLSSINVNSSTARKWLEKEPPDIERAARRLERVASEAERAATIVHGMRKMAKGGSGERVCVDLGELAREALTLVEDEARSNGVQLRIDRRGTLQCVWVDPVQIQQVVVNLVLNAVQAMTQSICGSRDVVLRVVDGPDDLVELAISDTGPGIAEEHLPRLFESFFTTKAQGIGMGLAISRSIVENHLGTLTIENAEGGGAIAHVRIPRCAAPSISQDGLFGSGWPPPVLPRPSYERNGTKL
ncbi:sensor histidine kinase [Novosphingobium gossypii]|uniref:sensor histidine kinase n=1 Tax=Novosphingobium gossypii TaxID=1604774 RepID=UPI003D1E032D